MESAEQNHHDDEVTTDTNPKPVAPKDEEKDSGSELHFGYYAAVNWEEEKDKK